MCVRACMCGENQYSARHETGLSLTLKTRHGTNVSCLSLSHSLTLTISVFACLDGSCLRPSTDKKSMFKDWMAWCQNCHHGGHAEHMREWYR